MGLKLIGQKLFVEELDPSHVPGLISSVIIAPDTVDADLSFGKIVQIAEEAHCDWQIGTIVAYPKGRRLAINGQTIIVPAEVIGVVQD